MSNFTRFLLLITTCLFCLGIQAQTCPGSLGTTVNIASLPYNGTGLTTCGAGNELTSSNVTTCGSTSYFGGEDRVFIFTPTSSGSITISLTSSSSWIGMMLYNGCPFIGQGGACVDNIQNSGGSKTLTVTVTSGVTYYLVVDTWPSPTCIPSFDLSIPSPAGSADPCSSITTLSCGTAVSATPSGTGIWSVTTCGFSTPGQEKIYSFTPTTTGLHSLQVNSVSGGYIDYFYKAASGGCNSSGWTCIDDINFTGTITIGTLTAGVQYYFLLDPEGTGSYNHNFQIVCPVAVDPCAGITTLACATPTSVTLSGSGVWNNSTCFFSTPGQEKVYSFTPTTTGVHQLQVTSASGTGYMDYQYKAASGGCSSTGWTCIDDINFATTVTIGTLTAGVQYYILLDAESTTSSTQTFQIVCPVAVDPCAGITTLACATSTSATLSGSGVWNNSTCFFSTPGQEKVYSFTPTVTGVHNLQVTSASGTGYMDYQYKAASGGCSSTGWTCIDDVNFTGTFTIGTLTAGVQYYILLDAESTASSSQTFQINCPSLIPSCLSAPTSPTNGAAVCSPGPSALSWPTAAGATSYEVYFGTSPTPPLYTTTSATSASVGSLPSGTYYWQIRPANSGGTASGCPIWSFSVDVTPPTIQCAVGTLNPAANANCQYVVQDLTSFATANDNCGTTTISQTPTIGTTLGLGSTTLTLTATDGGGNTATCTINLSVTDQTAPTITNCPNNQNVLRNASCVAVLPNYTGFPTTADNCPGGVTVTQMPEPGTVINSTVTVTLTATDAAANPATCSFTATPVDQTPPTVSAGTIAACYPTAAAAEAAAIAATTANDNCPGMVTLTATTAGTCSAVVTVTATDVSNNSASVAYNTRIDNSAPTVTAGTIAACYPTVAAAEAAALAATTATDNCPGAVTKTALTTGTCSAVITVTGADGCGNSASVTYNTRIDNTPPTVTAGTIAACYPTVAAAEAAALAATTATDNCPGAVTKTALTTGTCSAVITVTGADGCGNSASVTYNTRIDNTAPTVTAGTIAACYPTVAAAEAAALAATTATDNCPGAVTKTALTTGTCSAVITVTGADGCGNSASVTYNTRIDNTPPTAVCKNATVYIQNPGGYVLQVDDVYNAGASSDNCPGPLTVTNITPSMVTCNQVGQTIPVTVTVQDGCGNSATCTAQVTVQKGTGLPAGWSAANIGTTAQGSSTSDPCNPNPTFILQANGYTTNTSDVQHSVYQNLCGNAEIIAHVSNISTMGGWAGIQMRETTSQGSKKFAIKTQLNTILRREARSVTFGPTNVSQMAVPPSHTWLRITRAGNVFTAFSSADGVNWDFRSVATIAMTSCLQVGIFVESINNTTTTQASFDNVSTSGGNQTLAEAPNSYGIQDMEMAHEVSLFPNPTTGELNVALTAYAGRPVRLEVCNLFGQVMHYLDIDEVQHEPVNMDLSGYAKGTYLIRVISDGAPSVTKLFNIQ